jgi:O-acetyl-ADP-ribose deacetylase (regulator of RNase III)
MLAYFNSDITTVSSGIIVQGVNCQGVMNSGVARAIRNKWSEVYTEYMNFCDCFPASELLGKVNLVIISEELLIANCFTQLYYGKDGRRYADLAAIRSSLTEVFKVGAEYTMTIAMPKIGCGLGGLSWKKEVEPLVVELANEYPIDVAVYDTTIKLK